MPTIISKDSGLSITPSASTSENDNLISLVLSYPSSNLIESLISKETSCFNSVIKLLAVLILKTLI